MNKMKGQKSEACINKQNTCIGALDRMRGKSHGMMDGAKSDSLRCLSC